MEPASTSLPRWGTPLPAKLAYPLALLSGLLYFLAFPGIDLWPLAMLTMVPLLVALRGQTAKRALGLGWLAGFTMTMCGFYWLVEMLETFSGFPLPLCLLFMAILCAYQAGRVGLMGWLTARAERGGWPFGLAFALAFAASEQAFPLLFPWAFAGTVHQVPLLTQGAELGGPILVGLVLIAINYLVFEGTEAFRTRQRPRRALLAGLCGLVIITLLFGALRITMVDSMVAKAAPARVGLVQANMSLFGKRQDPREGLRRHLKLSKSLTDQRPHDLIVWSETAVGGAVDERSADRTYRYRVGRNVEAPAIFGAVLTRPVDDARQYSLSNSALVTDKRGRVRGRYDKQFLLGFGEYLPFGETFPILYEWSPNSGRFSPGKSFKPLPVGDHEVATFICYEDIIPSFVNRIMNNGDPDLLVNLTNDAWFGDTTEPWVHLALSKFRAIEQRRFFVRSTNSGVSAIVDPVGRVMSHTNTFEEATLSEEVRWMTRGTLYRSLGDIPWWIVSVLSLAMALVPRPRRSKKKADPPETKPVGVKAPPNESAVADGPQAEAERARSAAPPSTEFGAFPKPGSD